MATRIVGTMDSHNLGIFTTWGYSRDDRGDRVHYSPLVQYSPLWSPADVTARFLESLACDDVEVAEKMLAPDVRFRFGRFPVAGRESLMRRARYPRRYDVCIYRVSCDGSVVFSDRVDSYRLGRLWVQLAVRGQTRVVDGKIVDWRDRVNGLELAGAVLRAVLGVVIPAARPRLPVPAR